MTPVTTTYDGGTCNCAVYPPRHKTRICAPSGSWPGTITDRPSLITEEELRLYFLYLKNDKHASRSAFTIALSGLKFFYQHTLRREWATLDLPRPTREKKLPVVLSTTEVCLILGCLPRPHYACV